MLIVFCDDKKEEKQFRSFKVNELMEVPEPLSKEDMEKDKKALEQYNEDVKKAKEKALKTGKKVQPPVRPSPTKPKTHPPEITVNGQKKFLNEFVYIILPLSSDEGKTVSTMAKNGKGTDEEKSPLSENGKTALDYKITTFPTMVFCDWYGNELGRKVSPSANQVAAITEKAREEMMKKQMELEASLIAQIQEIEKSFEKEKETGKVSSATIARLKKLAEYKGTNNSYEPVLKARSYLKEAEALASN